MTKLTQITRDDFRGTGKALKSITEGTIRGIYTPMLLNTGIKQFLNERVGKNNWKLQARF